MKSVKSHTESLQIIQLSIPRHPIKRGVTLVVQVYCLNPGEISFCIYAVFICR